MSEDARAVVVTGAAGGMGATVAEALADLGTLVLVDVRQDLLERAAATLGDTAATVETIVADVTSRSDVAAVGRRVGDLGGLRAVVHTAGLSPTMASGRRVLDVDLVGTARMLDELLPHASVGTAAICIASIAGHADLFPDVNELLDEPLDPNFLDALEEELDAPLDSSTAYVLAKRGVIRACERLSGSWGARGAHIVSISPGLMDTAMGRTELEGNDVIAAMIEATPVRRPGRIPLPGTTEDIATLCAFLCSDDATFISGCDIRVDGGLIGFGRHAHPSS